jgi:hypothetical protein
MTSRGLLSRLINNESNPLLKYGFAVLIVFGPLYLFASYGYQWPLLVAVIILLGLFITRVRGGSSLRFTGF